jgi:hypothetical protein
VEGCSIFSFALFSSYLLPFFLKLLLQAHRLNNKAKAVSIKLNLGVFLCIAKGVLYCGMVVL